MINNFRKLLNYQLSILIYLVIRLLKASYRWNHINQEMKVEADKIGSSGTHIFCMWHCTTIPGLMSQWGTPHQVLFSQSKDGDLVEFSIKKMGYIPVRGSSTRGGLLAKEQMMNGLMNGVPASITPDGPIGPAKYY